MQCPKYIVKEAVEDKDWFYLANNVLHKWDIITVKLMGRVNMPSTNSCLINYQNLQSIKCRIAQLCAKLKL